MYDLLISIPEGQGARMGPFDDQEQATAALRMLERLSGDSATPEGVAFSVVHVDFTGDARRIPLLDDITAIDAALRDEPSIASLYPDVFMRLLAQHGWDDGYLIYRAACSARRHE